jgi:DNA-binding HxlR family transcriptional regulator
MKSTGRRGKGDINHTYKDSERPVRETLNRVGDRWTIYVVSALRDGPKRFNQLKRKVSAISARMLILTLKKLERDGIVVRTLAHSKSPRVEYRLTQLGRTFLLPIGALVAWAGDHGAEIEAARARYDAVDRRDSEPCPTEDEPRSPDERAMTVHCGFTTMVLGKSEASATIRFSTPCTRKSGRVAPRVGSASMRMPPWGCADIIVKRSGAAAIRVTFWSSAPGLSCSPGQKTSAVSESERTPLTPTLAAPARR